MREIVQAAIKLADGEVITLERPARHPSIMLHCMARGLPLTDSIQGFIYRQHASDTLRFCNRTEGYLIAVEASQLLFPADGKGEYPPGYTPTPGTLYTEDLW